MNQRNDHVEMDSADFIAARAAMAIAQRAANRPSSDAPGFPVAVKSSKGVGVLVFFLSNPGPTGTQIEPPDFFVQLDQSGKVENVQQFEHRKIEAFRARAREPGVGVAHTLAVDDYVTRRKQLLDISPIVWAAFKKDSTTGSRAAADIVTEYWHLFCAVTRESDAPYYLEASPAFFDWVRALAK